MKRLLPESLCKGSYLPHIRLVLAYLIEIPSMPLQSKIGACGVSLSGLPISNRDIAARGYPVISGWGANQIPLCSFQKRKAAYIPPENRGYARPGSNLLPENSGYWLGMFPLVAMLCKVTFQIEPLKDEIRCLAALPCLCNV